MGWTPVGRDVLRKLTAISEKMSQHAYNLGSADNITVMILLLLRSKTPSGKPRSIIDSHDDLDGTSFDSLQPSNIVDKRAAAKSSRPIPFDEASFGLDKMDSKLLPSSTRPLIAKNSKGDDGVSLSPESLSREIFSVMDAESPLKPRDRKYAGPPPSVASGVLAEKKPSDTSDAISAKKTGTGAADDDIMNFLMDDSNFKNTLK